MGIDCVGINKGKLPGGMLGALVVMSIAFMAGCRCCPTDDGFGGACCPNFCASGMPAAGTDLAGYEAPHPRFAAEHEVQAPVIRAQYTSDGGRSMPPLPPGATTMPRTTVPYNTTPYTPSYTTPYTPPAASTPAGPSPPVHAPAHASTAPAPGAMPASVAPAYGNQWPKVPHFPPTNGIDVPGELFPGGALADPNLAPPEGTGYWDEPTRYIDINPRLRETQTGRLMFGVGVNSDAGMVGSIVVDEQNFNLWRFPRSWEEIRNATAWRGAGQRFRLEAMPGTEVQRYMVNFQEPYLNLFNAQLSAGVSGYYYTRRYREWDEDRVGGRLALGYLLAPDLSATIAYRGAKIGVFNPVPSAPAALTDALGDSALHGFKISLVHDTRDNKFMATEGHLIEMGVEQVIGSYSYPRADIDLRRYFLLRQRPDGSGRHVLKLGGSMSVTGGDTPIYEHYFAGGFSTIRGFDFRGASPQESGVMVGGEFMLLASIEYLFPITADDAIRGVVFCDTGTVEPSIENWSDRYRVAPGFGFRIVVPAMGPAPIALDFAFPVSADPGDRKEVFSFFVGFER